MFPLHGWHVDRGWRGSAGSGTELSWVVPRPGSIGDRGDDAWAWAYFSKRRVSGGDSVTEYVSPWWHTRIGWRRGRGAELLGSRRAWARHPSHSKIIAAMGGYRGAFRPPPPGGIGTSNNPHQLWWGSEGAGNVAQVEGRMIPMKARTPEATMAGGRNRLGQGGTRCDYF